MTANADNVILIGMPGVGKSTVGVLLAKASQRGFLDTDVELQARAGCSLERLIEERGTEGFLRAESDCVLALNVRRHVIATGGSVVYSEAAMRHLKAGGVVVHLDLPPALLDRRLGDLRVRGVVMPDGGSLVELWQDRTPRYRAWADLTVDGTGKTQDQVAAEILSRLD